MTFLNDQFKNPGNSIGFTNLFLQLYIRIISEFMRTYTIYYASTNLYFSCILIQESGLAVAMTKQLVNVSEGETLQIDCRVSGAKGLLSVSWQHKKTTSSSFSDIITLSREGVMGDVGAQYQHRGLRTFRSNVADFVLELSGALVSDSGEYMCTVSEWSMESNGNLKKVNSQSQQGQVSVNSIGKSNVYLCLFIHWFVDRNEKVGQQDVQRSSQY